jgi:hypothetical protein
VHGEVTDPEIDLFDREAVFIERVMRPLRRDFPALNIVFEHITTKHAAQYVAEAEGPIAATITAHHLLYNRNDIFKGGIRPHYYCLPVLKREEHRLALVTAATSGDERFFLGTDSAPHARAPRKLPAAAPAATPRCTRWSCMPKPSNAPARWTSWKPSPAERPGLLQPAAHRHHHAEARTVDAAEPCRWQTSRWCRSTPAKPSTGKWCKSVECCAIDWSQPWYDSVRTAAGFLSADEHFRDSFSKQAAALDCAITWLADLLRAAGGSAGRHRLRAAHRRHRRRAHARQPARLLQRSGVADLPAHQSPAERLAGGADRARRRRQIARSGA